MNPTMYQPQMPQQYMAHLASLEQARNQYQGQTIQTLKSIQPQVQCYFVGSPEEMGQIQAQMNTVYIGINEAKNEVYIRRWTNNGLIELKTYTQAGERQEQPEWKMILAELESIKTKLNGGKYESNDGNDGRKPDERNVPTTNATGNVGTVAEVPRDGLV